MNNLVYVAPWQAPVAQASENTRAIETPQSHSEAHGVVIISTPAPSTLIMIVFVIVAVPVIVIVMVIVRDSGNDSQIHYRHPNPTRTPTSASTLTPARDGGKPCSRRDHNNLIVCMHADSFTARDYSVAPQPFHITCTHLCPCCWPPLHSPCGANPACLYCNHTRVVETRAAVFPRRLLKSNIQNDKAEKFHHSST